MSNKVRIGITGIGIISSIGFGKEAFWESLILGKTGFKKVSLFETENFKCTRAAEITDFNPQEFIGNKGLRYFDRSTKLILSASKCAIDETKGFINENNSDRVGVVLGTAFGSISSINHFDREALENPNHVNPMAFPNTVINSPASQVSVKYGFSCLNLTMSTGFAASLDAIGYSADFVRKGMADTIFTGGVEELCFESFAGFNYLGLLSQDKDTDSLLYPYDKKRDGLLLGEGAVVLVIESIDQAQKRGADILAEIVGYGTSCDAFYGYSYNPKAEGAKKSMLMALHDAGIDGSEIDYICGNGNGSIKGDSMEISAIKSVFGECSKDIPISSIKSSIGECYGASGAFQTAAGVMAIKNNMIPGIVGFSESDFSEDINLIGTSVNKEIKTVLINSFDCKGINSSLIIKKYL